MIKSQIKCPKNKSKGRVTIAWLPSIEHYQSLTGKKYLKIAGKRRALETKKRAEATRERGKKCPSQSNLFYDSDKTLCLGWKTH